MADFKISTKAMQGRNWKPTEGGDGPAALLKKDGLYQLKVVNAEAKVASNDAKFLSLSMTVLDTDEAGAVIYNNIFPEGVYEKGKREGHPRVEDLYQFIASSGRQDLCDQFTAEGSIDLAKVAGLLKDSTVYAQIAQREGNDGVLRSEPVYFVLQDKYESRRSAGAGFRTEPRVQTRKAAGAAAAPGSTAGAVVTSAMADDV